MVYKRKQTKENVLKQNIRLYTQGAWEAVLIFAKWEYGFSYKWGSHVIKVHHINFPLREVENTSKYGVISGLYFPVFGLKTIRCSHFVIKIFALYKNFCILIKMHISITADITHFLSIEKKSTNSEGNNALPKKRRERCIAPIVALKVCKNIYWIIWY